MKMRVKNCCGLWYCCTIVQKMRWSVGCKALMRMIISVKRIESRACMRARLKNIKLPSI